MNQLLKLRHCYQKKRKVGKCTRQFSEVYICVKTPNILHFRKNSFLLQENFKSGEFKQTQYNHSETRLRASLYNSYGSILRRGLRIKTYHFFHSYAAHASFKGVCILCSILVIFYTRTKTKFHMGILRSFPKSLESTFA